LFWTVSFRLVSSIAEVSRHLWRIIWSQRYKSPSNMAQVVGIRIG
jgi:hypothetical protein